MTAEPGCVVVGAGLAAANVVETLRDKGYDGSITLIGDEYDRPYERPPLSKDYLQGNAAIDDAYVQDEGWFADNNIDTRFGETGDWQPYFFTDQFDLGMAYVGHASAADDVVIRGDKSSGEFIAFWLSNGLVSAAMNVNIWDVNDDLRALVGREIAPDRLADNDIELADL